MALASDVVEGLRLPGERFSGIDCEAGSLKSPAHHGRCHG